jgi:ankyrin repeat protein
MPLPRLGAQVVRELELQISASSTRDVDSVGNMMIQLGLCHITGFGMRETSYIKAVELVTKASRIGVLNAQAALPSLSNALGIEITNIITSNELQEWQTKAFARGSRIATRYCRWHKPWISGEMPSLTATTRHELNESELVRAVKRGDLESVLAQLQSDVDDANNHRQSDSLLPSATPLHHAALLPPTEGIPIVTALIEHGYDPFDVGRGMRRPAPLSSFDFLCNEMPPNTSAIDWAIIEDNVGMVQLILRSTTGRLGMARTYLPISCKYLSVACLQFLLEQCGNQGERQEAVRSFYNGYSLLYWALCPDIFPRLLRCSQIKQGNTAYPTTLAMHHRQIEIIDTLCKVASDVLQLKMTSRGSFTAIHLLSAYGEPEMLRIVLEIPELRAVVNEHLAWDLGYGSPLRDAILRGRKTTFDILILYGAELEKIALDLDAIHVCAQVRDKVGQEIAEILIQRSPKCLKVRSSEGFDSPNSGELLVNRPFNGTALHWAAYYNNALLAKLFVARGAKLLDRDQLDLTPLGIAVASRSIQVVELLVHEHRARGLPLQAWDQNGHEFGGLLNRWLFLSSSALSFILCPGHRSPYNDDFPDYQWVVRSDETLRFGTADFHFSAASLLTVKVLIDNYKPIIRLGSNLVYQIAFPPTYDLGLKYAIVMGNLKALRLIMESKTCEALQFDLKFLLRLAVDIFTGKAGVGMLGSIGSDIAETTNYPKILGFLIQQYQTQYEKTKAAREASWMRTFWKLYYRAYGDLEHDQYAELISWQQAGYHERLKWKPSYPEFQGYAKSRFNYSFVNLVVSWPLLISQIVLLKCLSTASKRRLTPPLVVSVVLVRKVTVYLSISS